MRRHRDVDTERLHQVQGLMTLAESQRLYDLATHIDGASTIVEIGAHTGRSTCFLAKGAQRGYGAHVVSIDPWPDPNGIEGDDPFELGTGDAVLDVYRANIESFTLWSQVTTLRTTSLDAAKTWVNPIGMLFIDALHGYGDVHNDCEAWLPKLRFQSVLAMHDWFDDPALTHESQVADALHDVWDESAFVVQQMSDNLFVAVHR